ncbi:MAG: acetyl-CoA synthase subunit gamma [Planctomycetes bacterium]|nr:acetyl-CoA synthase subunit gamma [Planctomycetota bacterium]
MQYRVQPGLYAAGTPTSDSPVLVSANYKMSFDRLRSQLEGIDAWIVVLDTQGVNVWCAAGKGTFGTDEIVDRVEAVGLGDVVSHRRLIVPQLGAPGVAAHEVKRRSGFRVVYGPVRAEDLRAYLAAGRKATPEMRRVRFPLRDRLAVAPLELVMSGKYAFSIAAGFFFLAGIGPDGYSWARVVTTGTSSALLFLAVWAASTLLVPALLPWLPGRPLAAKGTWLGFVFVLGLGAYEWHRLEAIDSWPTVLGWCLMIPAVSAFMGMNFTGSTTYTSLSGVRREVRVAGRIQAVCAVLGVILWLVGRFV